MSAKFLLPNRFKKFGVFMAPLGFLGWIAGQWGYYLKLLALLPGEKPDQNGIYSFYYHIINSAFLIITFFSFLAGIYFLAFSKEKIEDEFISTVRLESFQIAALMQLGFFIISFVFMVTTNSAPANDAIFLLFFIAAVFLFWLFYIIRFNYVLHWKKH